MTMTVCDKSSQHQATTTRHVPLQTDVSPGSGGILQFVPAGEKDKQKLDKKDEARNAASGKIREAKAEVKLQWDAAKKQLHEPGKMHRVERYAVLQLPYHPYMDSGTSFNADLRRPLDFGSEPLTPAVLEHIGNAARFGERGACRLLPQQL
jgi:hypothetical protein